MKIAVISDTHGNIEAFDRAMNYFADADLIVHAGDVLYHPPRLGWTEGYSVPALAERLNGLNVPLVIAQGNCDAQVYEELLNVPVQAPYALVELDGVRIVANHGHLMSREQMIEVARRYRASYFVSGHTHIPSIEEVDGLVLMNPGSPAIPKYEVDGKPAPSIGLITESRAQIINVADGSVLLQLDR